MNKEQYIKELEAHLSPLDAAARADALDTVGEHFAQGAREGRSEDDIARALGTPTTLARQFVGDTPQPQVTPPPPTPQSPPPQVYTPQPPAPSQNGSVLAAVTLWVANLLVVYPVLLSLTTLPLGLIAGGIVAASASLAGLITGRVSFMGEFMYLRATDSAASLLLCISSFCIGLLMIVGTIGLTILCWRKLILPYLKWSGRIMVGGKNT